MQPIRQPAVAGAFYPSDPEALRALVHSFLRAVVPSGTAPKAIIAPHAGYVYSGPIAAHAYARLGLGRSYIRRVLVVGPAHRVAFPGLAISSAAAFATPLGPVPVDREATASLLELPFVHTFDPAHALEHSLEVQLPFLQACLESFSLLPIVVGEADPAQVGAALDRLWGGRETAIVISSDLSHYHDYATAQGLDRATSTAIEALRPTAIDSDAACGSAPIRGMLAAAQKHGLSVECLDLRNSGDTAGDKQRVVGYGAYAFT